MTIKKTIKGDKLEIVTRQKLTAMWIKKDFCLYDDMFKAMRDKTSDKFNRCFACNWPFQLNVEKMSLACFSHGVGNKPLCKDCADELIKNKSDD